MRTYPHHLTTDLPVLPVPRLDESLERYRKSAAAVLDASGEADVNQAIADFAIGQAPVLQQTLEEYGQALSASGSNWMAEQWLEHALRNRQPLLLSSNVTYQLNLPTDATRSRRVVELLQRIGAIHIQQAKRATPEELDADGRRLSMDSWACFNGGIRTPAADEDLWMRAGAGATYRTIGVLHLGRMWEVPLTGSEGKLLNAIQLRSSIEHVLSQTQPAQSSFAGFSTLGSAILAEQAPWRNEAHRSTFDRLVNMLFTITLDPNGEEDTQTLLRWAFHPGNAWVYKPISYQASLDTNMLTANVEHSVLEAGTLATAVTRMQQVDTTTLDTQSEPTLPKATELTWRDNAYGLTDYYTKANTLKTERVLVRRDRHLPYEMRNDALTHLILMIAQQLTFGTVRAHRQDVDMRHFRAGRTDTLRPVTLEAVSFVQHLVRDKATVNQLHAALNAHDEGVEATVNGQAFDRHFFMLQHIGAELGGANAALFTEHTDALEDFLTVSSAGASEAFIRAIAAPLVEDGFHVHFTPAAAGTEFLVTWFEGTPQAEALYRNLQPAAELLYDFIATIEPIHSS
ncbi:choline/carnitine O-acyltransferase [Yaniella halotolerans]|uniref:choline/carnitine O-acyltransferase n=1 Tax=Yaniella halotolerans TaxID=225453 RepID=UPI0003B521D0|nr:choline/carnitine O-acyltransferase [Yaniella halotolerans]